MGSLRNIGFGVALGEPVQFWAVPVPGSRGIGVGFRRFGGSWVIAALHWSLVPKRFARDWTKNVRGIPVLGVPEVFESIAAGL